MEGMGEVILTISELFNGKPIGVSSSITFALDGSLIGMGTYCKPVDEDQLENADAVSLEKATQIAYDDVFERYKEVLLPMDLLELKWTAERSTFEGHSVWYVSLGGLVRKDFPKDLQESGWRVRYYINAENGEILGRLEAS